MLAIPVQALVIQDLAERFAAAEKEEEGESDPAAAPTPAARRGKDVEGVFKMVDGKASFVVTIPAGFERSTFVLPLVESSLERVGKTLPEGVIVGGRGDHWFLHPTAKDTPILKDFTAAYRQRFNLYPIYPTFHMAQALYGLKAGYEKAMGANGGAWPSREQLMDTMRGLEFAHLTGTMKIREDGQGLEPMLMGLSKHVNEYPFPVIDRMVLYPPELTMNPVGTKGLDWVKLLTPASVQRAPAEIPYRA